jgi:translation initiation factor 1 (eIF-1/SUI1)
MYPRGVSDAVSQPIDFKKTSFKKASLFVESLAMFKGGGGEFGGTNINHLVLLGDKQSSSAVVLGVNKASPVLSDHKRKYGDYIFKVHQPMLDAEELDARDATLAGESASGIAKSAAAAQRIVAIEDVYRPRRSLPPVLRDMLMMRTPAETRRTADDDGDDDDDDLCEALPWRVVHSNLRQYIVEHGLLSHQTLCASDERAEELRPQAVSAQGPEEKKQQERSSSKQPAPKVALDHVLQSLWPVTSKAVPDLLAIKDLDAEVMFRGFCPMHYVVLGGGGGRKKRTLHNGPPPTVLVRTEKRCGNKTVTIVRNLEALDFTLAPLAQAWKHRFALSVELLNPKQGMAHVKSSTKVPWEIHLHGDVKRRVHEMLVGDMGIPASLIK